MKFLYIQEKFRRKHCLHLFSLAVFFTLLPHFRAFSQQQSGGVPLAFRQDVGKLPAGAQVGIAWNGPAAAKRAQKAASPFQPSGEVTPFTPAMQRWQSKQYTDPDGKEWTLVRLSISVTNAQAISLHFQHFQLPAQARLFVYSTDRQYVRGAFTHLNNRKNGFAIGAIPGPQVTVSYEVPSIFWKGKLPFALSEVGCLWEAPDFLKQSQDFGDAGLCQVNTNCGEGIPFQNMDNAITRIYIRNGNLVGWCSGTLVNNTQHDLRPLLLSAHHCAFDTQLGQLIPQSDFDQWIFYFGFEASGCDSPSTSDNIPNQSLVGATPLAHSDDEGGETGSDFLLLELSEPVPISYAPVYAGWDARGQTVAQGGSIHHPEGDLKKISIFDQAIVSSAFTQKVSDTHWEVRWAATENGHGVTESGSSGAPLLNMAGLVLGTLTGGSASCERPFRPDYYGKFSYHWDSNGSADNRQLRPWLDPLNTGALFLGGIDAEGQPLTEGSNNPELAVWPNPVRGSLSILMPDTGMGAQIEGILYDLQGRKVEQWDFFYQGFAETLSFQQLPPGMYLLRTAWQANGSSFEATVKIVKRP